MVSVFAEAVKELKDGVLVIVLRIARVKYAQEEVIDENADSLLQVFPKMKEETVED